MTGAFEIAAAIKLRKIISGEWLLALAGVLSVILGLLIAAYPGAGAVLLVSWIGAYAIVYGIVTLALAWHMGNGHTPMSVSRASPLELLQGD